MRRKEGALEKVLLNEEKLALISVLVYNIGWIMTANRVSLVAHADTAGTL